MEVSSIQQQMLSEIMQCCDSLYKPIKIYSIVNFVYSRIRKGLPLSAATCTVFPIHGSILIKLATLFF